jgi:hypothetical protein
MESQEDPVAWYYRDLHRDERAWERRRAQQDAAIKLEKAAIVGVAAFVAWVKGAAS